MQKDELLKVVTEMIAAPSCCPELKAAGKKYLEAAGTPGEKAAGAALLAEVKDDLSTVEHLIEFCDSPLGARILGADRAKAMGAHGREIKAAGASGATAPPAPAASRSSTTRNSSAEFRKKECLFP